MFHWIPSLLCSGQFQIKDALEAKGVFTSQTMQKKINNNKKNLSRLTMLNSFSTRSKPTAHWLYKHCEWKGVEMVIEHVLKCLPQTEKMVSCKDDDERRPMWSKERWCHLLAFASGLIYVFFLQSNISIKKVRIDNIVVLLLLLPLWTDKLRVFGTFKLFDFAWQKRLIDWWPTVILALIKCDIQVKDAGMEYQTNRNDFSNSKIWFKKNIISKDSRWQKLSFFLITRPHQQTLSHKPKTFILDPTKQWMLRIFFFCLFIMTITTFLFTLNTTNIFSVLFKQHYLWTISFCEAAVKGKTHMLCLAEQYGFLTHPRYSSSC